MTSFYRETKLSPIEIIDLSLIIIVKFCKISKLVKGWGRDWGVSYQAVRIAV
jgi:hypothetical protein